MGFFVCWESEVVWIITGGWLTLSSNSQLIFLLIRIDSQFAFFLQPIYLFLQMFYWVSNLSIYPLLLLIQTTIKQYNGLKSPLVRHEYFNSMLKIFTGQHQHIFKSFFIGQNVTFDNCIGPRRILPYMCPKVQLVTIHMCLPQLYCRAIELVLWLSHRRCPHQRKMGATAAANQLGWAVLIKQVKRI